MFSREALSRNPYLRERIQVVQIRGCLLPLVLRLKIRPFQMGSPVSRKLGEVIKSPAGAAPQEKMQS